MERTPRLEDSSMMDSLFSFQTRWDWGLGNPNKTAALIVILMLAVWIFAYIRRRGFWVSLILSFGLGLCLIPTYSRGGLVSLILGASCLIFFTKRPWGWRRTVAVIFAAAVLTAVATISPRSERFVQGIREEDASISNRFLIWKQVPRMMVDAPHGWGLGNSGNAYMQWYQPIDGIEGYRTLVSSHLTWMVELGWMGRYLYLTGWIAVFVFCWPDKAGHWLAVPLSIWAAFFTSAVFSSVAESVWLWIIPSVAFLAAVGHKISVYRPRESPLLRYAKMLLSAAGVLLALFGIGWSQQLKLPAHMRVHHRSGTVMLGKYPPKVWTVIDEEVMGTDYGKDIRRLTSSSNGIPPIGIAHSMKDIPHDIDALVVANKGLIVDSVRCLLDRGASVCLLNPKIRPDEIGIKEYDRLDVRFGQFTTSGVYLAWKTHFPSLQVSEIQGIIDYYPGWEEAIEALGVIKLKITLD